MLNLKQVFRNNGRPKIEPMDVEFKNIKLVLHREGKTSFCKKMPHIDRDDDAIILNDVSGCCKSGELLALMGPSGSGKTSLLNVIGGRIKSDAVTFGTVEVNGVARTGDLRSFVGYATQHEVFFPNLTVYETLRYTAFLRLGCEISLCDKLKKVEEAIEILELQHCRNTLVGCPMKLGLSGGEMKRLNLACELLLEPRVLLVDEPTSGLDSSSSYKLIRCLKTMAKKLQQTVICSIHQPSYKTFMSFDNILMLMKGSPVYLGSPAHAADYFIAAGLRCPHNYSIADYVSDITNDSGNLAILGPIYRGSTRRFCSKNNSKASASDECGTSTPYADGVVREVYVSEIRCSLEAGAHVHSRTKADCELDCFENQSTLSPGPSKFSRKAIKLYCIYQLLNGNRSLTQIFVLLCRSVKNSWPRCTNIYWNAQNIIMVIIWGLVLFRTFYDFDYSTLHSKFGFIFFYPIIWAFLLMSDIISDVFSERVIVTRELSSKAYPPSSYVISKALAHMIFACPLPALCLIILYFFTGLGYDFAGIVSSLMIHLLNNLVSLHIGLFAALTFPNMASAFTGCVTTCVISCAAGGFFVLPDKMVPWIEWLRHLSYVKYASNAIAIICIQPFTYHLPAEGGSSPEVSGQSVMAMYYPPQLSLGANLGVLAGLYAFFLAAALVGIRSAKQYVLR